ncbi:MAG: prolipoprotein diacylglyceryl transferase, partial [Lachnospiraceae bacterium]|nr:prolipoprotein diacylglyceryl transferase [Lachnospiraceae bacterium]
MYNDWFKIGPVTIHGYGACIAIGLLAALFLASHRAKKKG